MNLPVDFCERMEKLLGEEYKEFITSYDRPSVTSLRINPLKKKKGENALEKVFCLSPLNWCKEGFYYAKDDKPGKHVYHEAGVYYIQEASAMAPAVALEARPGEKILDLCSAPGGKSSQIAAFMQGQGILISNEINAKRAKILSENIERMGIKNAVVLNESPKRLATYFTSYFDKILVDAPCSGEGMFRKHPKACQEWNTDRVKECALRQIDILEDADKMLKTGGRLVYSTCTFAPEEDEEMIAKFLKSHSNYMVETPANYEYFSHGNPLWTKEKEDEVKKTCRLWPHKLEGEGHFFAVLKKIKGAETKKKISLQKGVSPKEYLEYTAFEKKFLKVSQEGEKLYFGDQLYLLPKDCPSLDGLRVIRPGLHLGTRKKGRFEPSHAFALSLGKEDVTYSANLSIEDGEANAYVWGQTLQKSGEGGWYLLLVDGYSLAWGKLSGQIMKNHYPKGLRKNLEREEIHAE